MNAPAIQPQGLFQRWLALPLAWLACILLSACASKPAAPDWQVDAESALSAAETAYLTGDARIARHELNKARAQIARTAQPSALAQLELRQCALQVASLDWQACAPYIPLRNASDPSQQAYADYLYAQVDDAQITLLPAAQQNIARARSLEQAVQALDDIRDPLSRLVAAATALRRNGQPSLPLADKAIEAASAQGWRRPLLAWLQLQKQLAEEQNLHDLRAQAQLRIQLLESDGKPAPR